MDHLGCRLRLDAKPTTMAFPGGQQSTFLQFAFNYHLGVAGHPDPIGDIANMLKQWDTAKEHSRTIVWESTGEQQS